MKINEVRLGKFFENFVKNTLLINKISFAYEKNNYLYLVIFFLF